MNTAFVAPSVGYAAPTLLASKATSFRGASVARPAARPATLPTTTRMVEDTFWEGGAPPSKVLGVGKNVPGALFLALSVVSLGAGGYCCAESNIFNALTPESVNPLFVAGSLLVPISWGCHVAAWIQFKNGK
eukprot:CAMPEP_0174897478 /NCGR_PEP_ID=MMETSP0167-20121228/14223_1 /TAXON_ID=38298 /ORGANISM="Rhodella maculata, Strain CCMP736" /LENGTH=131 /DNA_ID=CAMNT_0016137483 /DNA_START=65 /DNA_END=460 /DNA_ORIENTATION=-